MLKSKRRILIIISSIKRREKNGRLAIEKIGFIGAFDKTDLILYVARILVELQKKVLIIDSTILGRARYTVPSISPSKCYVTEFEGMDVAIGFDKIENIEDYLGTAQLQYDMILIDIDTHEDFIGFDMENADKNYFVTGFDNYSLKKDWKQ